MPTDDTDERRGDGTATDRRSFLGALGVSAFVGVESAAAADGDGETDDGGTTLVANRAPDGSRLSARPDGPVFETTDGTVHFFTWDEPGPGARAVLYDEDDSTDWGGGPDLDIYDTMARSGADAGDKPSLQATDGEWDRYKSSPELVADGHSGDRSVRVQDQRSSQGFVATFEETTEVFLSYCVKIPEGQAMPGGEGPGDFPTASSWKMAWLYHDSVGTDPGDVDIILPAWTPTVKLGGNNLDGVWADAAEEWWQWGEWMRLSFWLECGPEPATDDGRLRMQVVTEGRETTVVLDREFPIMDGGVAPFTWKTLSIPGWADATQGGASTDNVEALYDDIYLAVGDDANARLELSDDAVYDESSRIQLCEISSWSPNRVSAVLRKGSLDAVEGSTLHLTTAEERTAVSMEVE